MIQNQNHYGNEFICCFIVGPEDIQGGNQKLILGLIWTLICRYQIQNSGRGLSTKAVLKEWLNTMIPEYGISNFSTDWNDGRALCGLVDRLQPGLCTNHRSLNPNDRLENCRKGIKLAEDNLDIPPILDPEDMCNPEVDDLSIMTYLSYFFTPAMKQLLEWVQRKIPQQGIKNFSTDWNTGVNLAALIEACHSGLFPDWKDIDPHKAKENLEKGIKLANDRLDIKCPVSAAAMSDPAIDDIVVATYLSRFKYSRLTASVDEVVVYPPTLKDGYGIVKQPVEFVLELGSTPEAALSNLIFSAKSHNSEAVIAVETPPKSTATASFVPLVHGRYIVSCRLDDKEVSGCPFEVPIIDPSTWIATVDLPKSIQINKPITIQLQSGETHGSTPKLSCDAYIDTGDSLEQGSSSSIDSAVADTPKMASELKPPANNSVVNGLEKPAVVGEEFSFTVTPDAKGEVDVLIQGSAISYTPEIEKDHDNDGDYTVSFTPEEVGMHTVDVSIGNVDVNGSPFTLAVVQERPIDETDDKNAEELDNGDSEGNKGDEEQRNEKAGQVSEKPREKPKKKAQFIQSSISPVDESGKSNIYILPTGTGKAKGHITIGGIDITNSPFDLSVVDASDFSMSDLENQSYLIEQEILFTVNVKQSDIEPKVTLRGPSQRYTPDVLVEEGEEKQYHYTFTPHEPGVVKVSVLLAGEHIPGSPSTIQVSEPSIISEIPKFVEVGKTYTFDVLIDKSLMQMPTVLTTNTIDGSTEPSLLEASIVKNANQSNHWKLVLKPLEPGKATIDVKLGNFHIKKSPFSVKIAAIKQCKVGHIDKDLKLGVPFSFDVAVSEGHTQKPEVKIYTPSSDLVLSGTDNGNDTLTYTFTPTEAGFVKIAILFRGRDVPGSPFSRIVEAVTPPSNAKYCRAYGSALHPNVVLQTGRPFEFCIDTQNKAGVGKLQVIAQGPKHDPKVLMAEDDGIYTLRVNAVDPGWYHIHVWWSQVHIPGSPFHFKVHQTSDPSKVRVYGSGVGDEIDAGRPAEFYILTQDAGIGTLTVIVQGVMGGFRVEVKPEDRSDPRTLKAVYYPNEAGAYKVVVKWSGTEVPGSPFLVDVIDRDQEIEMARREERRKEKLKRIKVQQKIIRQQNKAIKMAMPDYTRNAQIVKSGQMAGLVSNESTIQRSVRRESHHRRSHQRIVHANSHNGLYDMRGRTTSAPQPKMVMQNESVNQQSSKRSRAKKLRSSHSFESAMQKNAEILGVHTPIGGSLKGGVTPMWHNSFKGTALESMTDATVTTKTEVAATQKKLVDEPAKLNGNMLDEFVLAPMYNKNAAPTVDSIDELPVSITPLYDASTVPPPIDVTPVKGKKWNKHFSKKH